jgi:hypothetical protein
MTPEYRQAIARITVGKARGTGFLVCESGLVLTALHVLGDITNGFKPYGAQIRLDFGDKTLNTTWSATATFVLPSVDPNGPPTGSVNDWALLQIDEPKPPYPARPLPLAGVRFDPNPVAWDTWGFPTVAPVEGTGYWGSSAIEADVFEVSCPELHESMVDGISGAPLVVGGDVRGIVQQAFMTQDAAGRLRTEDSKLRARTLRSVMASVGTQLSWDDYSDLPFEPHVKEAVAGLFRDPVRLSELGKNVGVNVTAVRRELLPDKIARRALRQGLEPTYHALMSTTGLDPKEGAHIVEYVAAAGLQENPVREVRAGLLGEHSELAVLLCSSLALTARFFVWRARYGVATLGAFNKRVLTIDASPDEDEVKYVRSELRKQLAHVTGRRDKKLDDWIRKGDLFFVIVPGIVRQEVLEQLAVDFPGARFVYFAAEPPLRPQLRVRAVAPGLTPADERTIEERCTYAEADLTDST